MISGTRDISSGYELLNLLNSCTEDKKKIPEALVNKVLNHENYSKYKHLGLPDESGLNKMSIMQLFSFCNALDFIDEARNILKNSISFGDIKSLQTLSIPNLVDFDSLRGFISRPELTNNNSVKLNYTNITNPFDFFNIKTIKSLYEMENINPDKLGDNIDENIKKILGTKDCLYCISIKEYDDYIRKCKKEYKLIKEIEESEEKLANIEKTEKRLKNVRLLRIILATILFVGSLIICNIPLDYNHSGSGKELAIFYISFAVYCNSMKGLEIVPFIRQGLADMFDTYNWVQRIIWLGFLATHFNFVVYWISEGFLYLILLYIASLIVAVISVFLISPIGILINYENRLTERLNNLSRRAR
ncbi:MAG: hypothetical protein WDA24_10995 [Tissierellales bacterium]